MPDAIEVSGLRKEYVLGGEPLRVLHDIDFRAGTGEIVCVMGPSGSGKSTLLNLIGGLDRPSSGSIVVAGRELASLNDEQMAVHRREGVGFIFQSFNLMPALTATENVVLPLVFAGVPREEREERARVALERVGLAHRAGHRPREMSGGEQQRVAIARAIVNSPSVMLADEPTGNLDTATGQQVLDLMTEMNRTSGQTLVITTHDAEVAKRADRVVRLRDGEVVQDGEGST